MFSRSREFFTTSREYFHDIANIFSTRCKFFSRRVTNISQLVKLFTTGRKVFHDRSWIFLRPVVNFFTSREFFGDWLWIFSRLVANIFSTSREYFSFSLGSMNPHSQASVHVHYVVSTVHGTVKSLPKVTCNACIYYARGSSWSGSSFIASRIWNNVDGHGFEEDKQCLLPSRLLSGKDTGMTGLGWRMIFRN